MSDTLPETNADDLKAKAAKGAGINVVAQFLGTAFHIAGVVVLARLLLPKDFGLVAMVTAFSQWVMNFGVNGFTEYIIQKQDLSSNVVNSIFWIHLILATLLAIGFTCFGFFLVDFYVEPAIGGIAVAMSTSFIFYALFTSHSALLKRNMKFAAIAIVELTALVLSIVFAIAAALGGMEYWAIVIRQAMIPLLTMIGIWTISNWRPGFPQHLSDALPGLKYAFQVYCNFSLGYVTRNFDKVLLGKFQGSIILGNYDRAYHLSAMPANSILAPLHTVALSTLSRLRNDRERFLSYFIKAVSIVAFLGAAASLILMLSARDLIYLLLGPAWHEASLVFMAFSPGIAATLVYGTHPWLHLSLGTPNRWLRWNVCAAIFTVGVFIIAAPFGAVTMAVAYSATAFILIFPSLWYAGRPIQLGFTKVIHSLWPYFIAGISVYIFCMVTSIYWPQLKELLECIGPLSRIILNSCIALILYVSMVIILQRNLTSIRDVISIFKLILSREDTHKKNQE